jgi:hypothetical protein
MTTGAHSGARRAVDGTEMKPERPMVIGLLAGAEKEPARFSKPPPSATRPRLQALKPLGFFVLTREQMTTLLPFCYPFGLRCCSNAALIATSTRAAASACIPGRTWL